MIGRPDHLFCVFSHFRRQLLVHGRTASDPKHFALEGPHAVECHKVCCVTQSPTAVALHSTFPNMLEHRVSLETEA